MRYGSINSMSLNSLRRLKADGSEVIQPFRFLSSTSSRSSVKFTTSNSNLFILSSASSPIPKRTRVEARSYVADNSKDITQSEKEELEEKEREFEIEQEVLEQEEEQLIQSNQLQQQLQEDEGRIPLSISYVPQASPKQLRNLSKLLRSQLSSNTKSFDALFTLRQLHMLKRPNHYLPLTEDKWLWRLPTTSTIHSIIRLASKQTTSSTSTNTSTNTFNTSSDNHLPELVSFATRLASNALEHDTFNRSIKFELPEITGSLKPNLNSSLFGPREDTSIVIVTDLEENEIDLKDDLRRQEIESLKQKEKLWEEAYDEWRASLPLPSSTTVSPPTRSTSLDILPSPNSPYKTSSLRPLTLELLFTFLANTSNPSEELQSTLKSFSLTLNSLSIPQSSTMLAYSFNSYIKEDRVDLASRAWGKWVERVQSKNESSAEVKAAFKKIRLDLKVAGIDFGVSPRKKNHSTIAYLIHILNSQWKKISSDSTFVQKPDGDIFYYSPFSTLLAYLARFPISPFVDDAAIGGQSWKLNRIHSEVYTLNLKVFRNICQDIIGKSLYLKPLGIAIGQSLKVEDKKGSTSTESTKRIPLKLEDFNVLIIFALRHFNSPGLAILLLGKMRESGHIPSAATYNTLLSTVSSTGEEAMANIQKHPQNEQTLPTFLAYLTSISDFSTLDQLVYAVLPELDTQPFYLPPSTPLSALPPATPPPLDRNPYLYMTLLNALVKAGRTGLAERVFRLARWAAELSRETKVDGIDREKGIKPWVVPPHGFTMMLQLYALEAVRGQKIEESRRKKIKAMALAVGNSNINNLTELVKLNNETLVKEVDGLGGEEDISSPYVRGWGRHALRVFLLKKDQELLREQLGPTANVRQAPGRSNSNKKIPLILRREAASIVTLYELEGGSKSLELKSLQSAMKHEFSRSSMEILFPFKKIPEEQNITGHSQRRRERAILLNSVKERESIRNEKLKQQQQEVEIKNKLEIQEKVVKKLNVVEKLGIEDFSSGNVPTVDSAEDRIKLVKSPKARIPRHKKTEKKNRVNSSSSIVS